METNATCNSFEAIPQSQVHISIYQSGTQNGPTSVSTSVSLLTAIRSSTTANPSGYPSYPSYLLCPPLPTPPRPHPLQPPTPPSSRRRPAWRQPRQMCCGSCPPCRSVHTRISSRSAAPPRPPSPTPRRPCSKRRLVEVDQPTSLLTQRQRRTTAAMWPSPRRCCSNLSYRVTEVDTEAQPAARPEQVVSPPSHVWQERGENLASGFGPAWYDTLIAPAALRRCGGEKEEEVVHSGVFLGICRNDGFCITEFYRLAWTMCKLDRQVMSFCYELNFMGTNLVAMLGGFYSFTYAYCTKKINFQWR